MLGGGGGGGDGCTRVNERGYVGSGEKKGARAWVLVLVDGRVCV